MNNKENSLDALTINREIIEFLGPEKYKHIHKSNKMLDIFTVFSSIVVFIGVMFAVTWISSWAILFFLIIFQGFFIQTMGLISHDVFVHRRLGKDSSIAWIASIILTMARLSVPSGYRQAHLAHHKYIGKEKDTEAYKQSLNTRFRRILFSTIIGVKLAHSGKLSKNNKHYLKVSSKNELTVRRAKAESIILRVVVLSLLPLAFFFPKAIILGFLIPAFVVTPIAGTLRIIIEHGEVNSDNPYHIATYYRTNWLTQALFLWDSGDCHLIHHLLPGIPFYRMHEANNLIRPFLLSKGVKERRSFLELIIGWYVKNYEHRSLWPDNITQSPIVNIGR